MRRFFALLLAALFTFALLEVGAYAYLRAYRGYDGEHLMNYEFDPYKNIRLTPSYSDTRGVFHNSQGFRRSDEVAVPKPKNTLRVFLMGGSTAYGLRSLSRHGEKKYPVIRNDETIDHFLERRLDAALPDQRVEVINAAITSFYSHHHLIYLNQTILKYEPDLIVFLDGFNDYFNHAEGFDQFRDYAYQERSHVFLGDPTLAAWGQYTGWWFVRKSHVGYLVGHALRKLGQLVGAGGPRTSIDIERALTNLRDNSARNFVKMVERNGLILRHEGVAAVFALQPEIAFEQSKPRSPLEQQIYAEMVDHWQENYVAFKNRARPIVVEALIGATAVSGATFADLTDIYGGVEGDVYTDYCHLTPLGNQLLAEALAPQLLSVLERPEPATPVVPGQSM